MYEHVDLFDYGVLSEEHGCQPYAAVSPDTIETYRGKVPETLLTIWERHGLTSHGEGQLWFTNPDEFTDIIEALFGKTRPFIVYARDSFGRMSAVLGDRLYVIHPQIACAIRGNRIDVFDTMISRRRTASWSRRSGQVATHTSAPGRGGPMPLIPITLLFTTPLCTLRRHLAPQTRCVPLHRIPPTCSPVHSWPELNPARVVEAEWEHWPARPALTVQA